MKLAKKMRFHRRILYIFFLLNFLIYPVTAQKHLAADTATIQKVVIKNDLKKYKNDPAFDYVLKPAEENFLTKAWNWIKRKIYDFLYRLFSLFVNAKIAAKWVKVFIKSLPYLAILLFTYLIYRFLLGADFVLYGKNKSLKKSQVFSLEDEQIIKEADLDALIREAISNKDYRLASRYFYLKTLKLLMERHLIEWHPDKTNRDYVREIKDKDIQLQFKDLTFIYDYVWYGKYYPAEVDFDRFKKQFEAFLIPNSK